MVEYDAGFTNWNDAAGGFKSQPERRWRRSWAADTPRDYRLPPPLLVEGHLLINDIDGDIFPINIETGEYGVALGRGPQRPLVATSDTVYSWAGDSETDSAKLVAQDYNGSNRWELDLKPTGAIVVGKTLYVAVQNDDPKMTGIVALDRTAGDELWRRLTEAPTTDEPVRTLTFVAATQDRVFEMRRSVLTARDPESGDQLWQFEFPVSSGSDVRFGGPRLSDGTVLVPAIRNRTNDPVPRLWALPHSGPPVRWRWESEESLSRAPALVVTDSQIVGDDKAISLADGSQQWSNVEFVRDLLNSEYGNLVWDIAASGRTLFLGTGGGREGDSPGTIAAFNLDTGELQWQIPVEGGVGHLILGDGELFVVTLSGALEAYE